MVHFCHVYLLLYMQRVQTLIKYPGGTLICSFIHRLGSFLVQNYQFQHLGGGGSEILGLKILWIYFGGHHKICIYLGVLSMHFRSWYRKEDTFCSC